VASHNWKPVDILESLPPELRWENAPLQCLCSHCASRMSKKKCAAARARMDAWREARRLWRDENGVSAHDFFMADVVNQSN
jgi:hypothetical protein